ncbi:hypothetical protein LTR51_004139 [Lithohypha guttulata]|nr:hypothetical protein LTR51_004139 [Lithohypha guttulata]
MNQTLYNLPQDILLLVLQYLEAPDVRCLQLTSHACQNTFTDPIYLRTILRFYTCTREVRALSTTLPNDESNLYQAFKTIAARYYHLGRGKARRLQRLDLRALDQSGHWFPAPQWDYHESQPGGRLYHETAGSHLRGMGWKPYLFRPTLWSYSDGLLVYAPSLVSDSTVHTADDESNKQAVNEQSGAADSCLIVLDLESGSVGKVPFDITGKIIRNLRLRENTLIVEWAEKEPWHDLNMVDKVHRHFASCYDVTLAQPSTTTSAAAQVSVKFRSEWRVHFLGLPLTSRDYFFSTHTAKHYALYYWQPNRSLWTGDEDQPIEALFVWDISSSSDYRPSDDPTNIHARRTNEKGHLSGPRCVARYSMRELEWLGIRQHASISLTRIEIDSANEVLMWRENRFANQYGYFDPAERCWESTSTSFKLVGAGAVLRRTADVELVSYRGHCSMDSTEVTGGIEGWFLPVCEVGDDQSQVKFGLIETCFTGLVVENRLLARLRLEEDGEWMNLQDDIVKEVGCMGRIAGDERWLIGQNNKLQLVVARFQ